MPTIWRLLFLKPCELLTHFCVSFCRGNCSNVAAELLFQALLARHVRRDVLPPGDCEMWTICN